MIFFRKSWRACIEDTVEKEVDRSPVLWEFSRNPLSAWLQGIGEDEDGVGLGEG